MASFDSPDSPTYSLKSSSSLHRMLTSIIQEKARQNHPSTTPDDGGFIMIAKDTFWTDLFQENFIDGGRDECRDDMLFYVRKTHTKTRSGRDQVETDIEVFRRDSKKLPSMDDGTIDWEETVYLNLILQQFQYTVTCAVCTRTGEKELQILKKVSQKVYASPSRRQMDHKGTEEQITYPNIFFMVDNFEELFQDIIVRDSEMVCVELIACDRNGSFQGVIFLGSIRYDALKSVYDARASLSSRMAQRMSLGWIHGKKRVEFVRMRGPQSKGHAEMACSRVKGSGVETPDIENFPLDDFEDDNASEQYNHRRMSDPNASLGTYFRSSFRRSMKKSRSETENVDSCGLNGLQEVEAGNLEDAFDDDPDSLGLFGQTFGQAWHWFKDKKRANSVALEAYLTYITLPWHRIIADVLEVRQEPVLTF